MKKWTLLLAALLVFCVLGTALGEGGFVFASAEPQIPEEIDVTIHADMGLKLVAPKDEKMTRQWFENNTVCLRGLYIRDIAPELTSKWYNVLPIDLTKQGRQTFDLVASNLYYVGKAYVEIEDDSLTLTYDYYMSDIAQPVSECAAIFSSMDQLTAEYLENPTPNFTVGRPISISRSLEGSETALLFVFNQLSYTQPYDSLNRLLTRYWPNHPRYMKDQAALKDLLTKLK